MIACGSVPGLFVRRGPPGAPWGGKRTPGRGPSGCWARLSISGIRHRGPARYGDSPGIGQLMALWFARGPDEHDAGRMDRGKLSDHGLSSHKSIACGPILGVVLAARLRAGRPCSARAPGMAGASWRRAWRLSGHLALGTCPYHTHSSHFLGTLDCRSFRFIDPTYFGQL